MKNQTEKVLVTRDEGKIKIYRTELESALSSCQDVIDQAKKIGVEITIEKLADTRMAPIDVVRNHFKRTIRVPEKINGLPTNKEAYLEREMSTMQIPDPIGFEKSLKKFRDMTKFRIPVTAFEIVDGVAIINEDSFNEFCEQHTVYATTEKGKKIWAAYSKMVESLNEFNALAFQECGIKMAVEPHNAFHYFDTTKIGEIQDRKIIPIVGMWAAMSVER